MVVPPTCDILKIGCSCKSFSSLNNSRAEYDRAILDAHGSSGMTANYALDYVQRRRPWLLLIENVPGLFHGFQRKDPFTKRVT